MGISPGNTPSCEEQGAVRQGRSAGGIWAGSWGTGQSGPYLAIDDGVNGHEHVFLGRWLCAARGLAAAIHHSVATCWRGAGHVSNQYGLRGPQKCKKRQYLCKCLF